MAGFRTVIVNKMAKLETRLGYLVIRDTEETHIHISEIETLIIESTAVSFTAMLISELSKNGVAIVFCNEKHIPESVSLPIYGNFAVSKNLKEQIGWNQDLCESCWQEIVKQKIKMQAKILSMFQEHESAKLILSYQEQVQSNDKTNREGHAAKVYFNALWGLEFERRTNTPTNAALNYGYAILLACFSREIVASGYLTQLGIWHKGEHNAFNLSCDLMECFRPMIDFLVMEMDEPQLKQFKLHLQKLFDIKIVINSESHFLSSAIRMYIRRVFRYLNNEPVSLLEIEDFYFERKEKGE